VQGGESEQAIQHILSAPASTYNDEVEKNVVGGVCKHNLTEKLGQLPRGMLVLIQEIPRFGQAIATHYLTFFRFYFEPAT
jgi:hypothetical protein